MNIQTIGMLFAITCIIIGVIALLLNAKHESNYNFKCPNCNQKFKPKLKNILFTTHVGNNYTLTCPHCTKKDLCTRQEKATK